MYPDADHRFLGKNPEEAKGLKLPSKFKMGSKKHKKFEKVFQEMDKDKTSGVSWEEFATFFDIPPEGVAGLRAERPQTPGVSNVNLVRVFRGG